jgi:hypothetical protein
MTGPEPPTETTDQSPARAKAGGEQMLVPGVVPITTRDRLARRAAAPLAPRVRQKPCDSGLFDLAARDQLSLF